jgi:pimeloyl-ACP methyl ester carboxylesterase
MFVEIGGIEQWIQIGAESKANPVLLFLHGGPGGSSRPAAAAWKSWEKHFIVVHWDQRGAGLTFGRNGPAGCGRLTINRMINDGIEVVEFLRHHLSKDKIFLMGHSWGSGLGISMVHHRPDLFSAYVGTGQLVNKLLNEQVNYERQLSQACAEKDEDAKTALLEIGPPPFDRVRMKILREWADKLAEKGGDDVRMRPTPMPAGWAAVDSQLIMEGNLYSREQLFDEVSFLDLRRLGLSFDVPIFFLHGTADQQTPFEIAEQYIADITAPVKQMVRFEHCHHFVVFNRPNEFLSELLDWVHPIVRLS